ncbi:hypothetical protein GCK72_006979 [Caenorhabditis remanei]|uniref:Uncharacterized protein n=1 Tax=Caenorhabditis remanei TaxID=31234 RepID=A0A6A5HIR6_CAERE|nr:hypothetical protein GCK72_006979 [Caenorhabditis remanei]KAF1767021.1 hypothetical protein GCK72_006979 [Caenorhabditis remanei]
MTDSEEVKKLKQQLEESKAREEVLKETEEDLRTEVRALRDERTRAFHTIHFLRNQVVDKRERLEDVEEENAVLREQIELKDAIIEHLHRQLERGNAGNN